MGSGLEFEVSGSGPSFASVCCGDLDKSLSVPQFPFWADVYESLQDRSRELLSQTRSEFGFEKCSRTALSNRNIMQSHM